MTAQQKRLAMVTDARPILKNGDDRELIALLESPEPAVRELAVVEIGRRDLLAAAPVLNARVLSEDLDVRNAAMVVLAKLATPESHGVFASALNDSSETVRRMGLRGLSRLREPATSAIAAKLYPVGTRLMKLEVIDALVCIGDEDARRALRRLIDAEPSWRLRRVLHKAISRASRPL